MSRIVVDDRPIYTHYIDGYNKIKTNGGFSYDSAYLKRYYSSLDAEIYFGNKHVEEVVDINWNISQNQMPLYGYNSYVFDEVALGSRIIQGVFAINFTAPNYLFNIIEAAGRESLAQMEDYRIIKSKEELTISEQEQDFAQVVEGPDRAPIWQPSFDIDVIFGQKTNRSSPVHVVLENVQLRDARQGIDVSGSPVVEIYSFIARDFKSLS